MAGKGSEGMVGTSANVGDLNGLFENRHCLLEPAQAAINGGEDMEAHGEVEAGLAIDGAPLERLGSADRVV